MDWLKKLKDYAPDIAMAVVSGGATLPQLAMKAVADAIGKSDIKTQGELVDIISGATPETMLAIKKANNDFALEMKRLELDWQKAKLTDNQQEHSATQETIRNGDNSTDTAIRMIRPNMATKSWTATIAYCIGCFGVRAITGVDMFDIAIATILSSPAWAYLGLRTSDKIWGKTK